MPAAARLYVVGAGPQGPVCDCNTIQCAIDAAVNSPGEDEIRVANDQSYTAQALSIGQQDLTIVGGYASCTAAAPFDAQPTGTTIVSGSGGSAAPVFTITGSGVRALRFLQIRNGDNVQGNGTGCGGGIRYVGRGQLQLTNVGVAQNSANQGGGLCVAGDNGTAVLNVYHDTAINNNEATTGDGGGIYIAGNARMYALEPNILIAFNRALSGDGGGIYGGVPAQVNIGSPGSNGLGVLYANEAQRGGGFAYIAEENAVDQTSCARLFSTDASRPIRVQNNRASSAGGAFFTRTNEDVLGFSITRILAHDIRIDGNQAPNGPVILASGDGDVFGFEFGSEFEINTPFVPSCFETLADLGRVECTNTAECNRIENNRARDFDNNPTNGNVIELWDDSSFNATDMLITGNEGTRLISGSTSDLNGVTLRQCALVGNTVTQELIRMFNDAFMTVRDTTIAGNAIGNTHVIRLADGTDFGSMVNVLIDQPGRSALSNPSVGSLEWVNQWIIANDTSGFRPDPTVQPGRGRFVDPEAGDYRLRVGSMGVDYAPATPAQDRDLDNRPRDVDLFDSSANTRARDLGPYERGTNDPWLVNGDFVGNLRHWTVPDPTHAAYDAANAPTSVGGSIFYSAAAGEVGPTDRRVVASTCFNVPANGDYQIVGYALAPGATQLTRDYPLVSWRLRYNSEDCTGPVDASGQAFFGRSSTIWQPLAQAAAVPVPLGSWTWNTTIEVVLEAAQNLDSPTASGLFARFDEIEIIREPTEDLMFKDSFEDL